MARKSTTGRAKVRLHRHQAGSGGEPVNAFDLNTVQDNVQKALDQIQLSCECSDSSGGGGGPLGAGVVFDYNVNAAANINGSKLADNSVSSSKIISLDGSKLVAGSVATAALANGAVTATKLAPSLLQGFHVECAGGLKIAPSASIAFATQSWGAEQWSDTTTLALLEGGYLRIHAQLIFLGEITAVLPGARAQLVMVNHLGAVVAAGPTCVATPRIGGTVELVATLDEELNLSAGGVETYHFQYLAEAADGSAVALWLIDNTGLAASPPVGGSFVEGMVVPRPSTG